MKYLWIVFIVCYLVADYIIHNNTLKRKEKQEN